MPYELKLKIYTNENIPEGSVKMPEDPVSGSTVPLFHCHPNDFAKMTKIIAAYFRIFQGDDNGKKEEGSRSESDSRRSTVERAARAKESSSVRSDGGSDQRSVGRVHKEITAPDANGWHCATCGRKIRTETTADLKG